VVDIFEFSDWDADSEQPSNANSDALRFLESLSSADPSLAEAALTTEIDDILGRAPERAATKAGRTGVLVLDEEDERGGPDFGWYARLLEQTPSPDDAHTYEAARRVEVGLLAEARLEVLNRSVASRRQLAELHTLREEGREAWDWLVRSNLRLVFHWSKGVARSVDPDWAQDAFQVGCLGLMRGLQGWDFTMGYKLSTFVSWHVRQAIQRWRANDVMIIRLPVHVWEALGSGDSDLTAKVSEAAARAQDPASLEAMIVDRGEDAPWDSGMEALEERIDRERTISHLLEGLDERSLDIVERRFGLREDLDGPMTLDEIGDVWGVTRERIRQLEKKILDTLRERAAGRATAPIGTRQMRRNKSLSAS
jgi:RNA polymerase sigma factor (sigma-70 family)